ncbi:hypothetical protein [Vibrio coralliilyticus]|uniref:hypothetical protein n=1 Tax=Vibrio coralliilyticus TaxID=190893 RepID=UPI0006CDCD8E|nr:hypothetical protein [Vibrio coralliilyticus]AXN30212.1 hypothetical protein DVV14_02410 [Vibrio coralliilyticus]KPH25298.1 hypothetical protein ADU60_08505 [Vibrio coralliilyticus]
MKYKIPGVTLFITFSFWLWQQWLVDLVNTERVDFPWFWLFMLSLAFLVGIFYSDLFNEHSRLKKWLDAKRRIFSVDHFVLASNVSDGELALKATCGINFLSRMNNVHITIQVTQYISTDHAKSQFVILQDKLELTDKNLAKKYVFATFPKQTSKGKAVGYPYWGESNDKSWAGDGMHVVTLTARSFYKTQKEHFLISAIRNPGNGPEPVLLFGGEETKSFIEILEP